MNPNDPVFPCPKDSDFLSPGLTKREYACIRLGVPETEDAELDALIRKFERKRIAAKAMQSLIPFCALNEKNGFNLHGKACAKASVDMADALLKSLEETK